MFCWIVKSFQIALWDLKGCAITIDNFSETPVLISNKTWDGCSVIRFLGGYFPSGVDSNGVGRFLSKALKWGIYAIIFLANFLLFARNLINSVAHGFILFAHNLFNLIACGLLNCFARNLFNYVACVFLNALINPIFVVRIYLKIFLTPILFLLWKYTVSTNGNVCNVFKMCSTLLRIHCTYFWFLMTNINMFFHVSVYRAHFFYLLFVYFHNLPQ